MGTITRESRKSGKQSFRAEVRREGKRITKRFPSRSIAKQWIHQKEIEIIKGEYVPRLKRYSLGDAIERDFAEVLPHKRPATQSLYRSGGKSLFLGNRSLRGVIHE